MKQRFKLTLIAMLLLFGFSAVQAQVSTVTGVVKDNTGLTVIGASVVVKGTTNGTITDFDGNFSLQAAADAVLQVSYVGYAPQEIAVGGKKMLEITLLEDSKALEEVMVIGYGVVKKSDATGSVTAIKPDEMNKGLTTNAQEMLAGKVAGVSIVSHGGTPGAGATIRIRGGSSLSASNDPLIVIDGLVMDNTGIKGVANPLSMVNPNDIETFTVLKDASATAIYGSRASNGVILITTKKGKAGQKMQVSYEGNVSMSVLTDMVEVFDGPDYIDYIGKLKLSASKMADLGTDNTNWSDQVHRNAISTDHNINLMGGTKNMPYRFSVGYTLQNGIVKTSNMQRTTASLNLSPSFLDDHLKFNVNAKGLYIMNRYADGVTGAALTMDPTQPVYDDSEKGKLFGGFFQYSKPGSAYNDPNWGYLPNVNNTPNPLASLMQNENKAKSQSFVGNVSGDYQIHGFEDLRLHANFGADYSSGRQKGDRSPYSTGAHYFGRLSEDYEKKYNMAFNTYAQYYKDFENHHFDAMVGYEWQHFYKEGTYESYGVYPDTNNDPELVGTKYSVNAGEYRTESFLVSFFGRLNYTALNRYMITATVRGDGSSRFAPNNRWGIFPSLALGWKIKEEAFLQDVNWLSDLKLRLGYGITGQQELGKGDYPYLPIYMMNKDYAYYTLGELDANGDYIYCNTYRPDAVNPDLTWEKTTTYNAGLDYGFLNSRITGSIDFYHRNTVDLLNEVNVAAGTNFKNRVISNVGSLYNRGVEFAIQGKPVVTKDFTWDVGFNFTYNENKITELISGEGEDYYISGGGISTGTGNTVQASKVGYPVWSYYVYETKQDENGEYYFVDQLTVDSDGDGKNDAPDGQISADDRIMYKNAAPKFMFGFTSKFLYKNFDLSFSLRANVGNYIYNDVLANNLQYCEPVKVYREGAFRNITTNAYELYWGDKFKSDNPNFNGEWYLSDQFIENASFLRCDNITLGYSFEGKLQGRVYATVSNPFVISGYKGLDPEVSGGIDNNIYPRAMTTMLGVSLKF